MCGQLRRLRVFVVLLALQGVGCGQEGEDDAGQTSGSDTGGRDTGGRDGGTGGRTAGGGGSSEVPSGDYCAPTEDWPESSTAKELEMLELVNAQRAEGASCAGEAFPPREPLEMLPSLHCAARMHSADMLERDYFSHTSPEGTGPSQRMAAAGYAGRGWAENIAAGNATAAATLEQWMNSEGHCRNIMGNYRYFGVGYVQGGSRRHLWTQTFGN